MANNAELKPKVGSDPDFLECKWRARRRWGSALIDALAGGARVMLKVSQAG